MAEGANVSFSSAPTGDAIRAYADGIDQRVWIVGGGRVIVDGMNDGAIDVLELYVMPDALGSGIPLFPDAFEGTLTLSESRPFDNGVVKLVYDVSV